MRREALGSHPGIDAGREGEVVDVLSDIGGVIRGVAFREPEDPEAFLAALG